MPPQGLLNFGRIEDPKHVEALLASMPFQNLYEANPSLADTSKNTYMFLWDAEFAVTGQVRPPHNQQTLGDCTGEGTGGALEDLEYVDIGLRGEPREFHAVAHEFLYGGGRVQIGGRQLGGTDGAATSWLIDFAIKYGYFPRGIYNIRGQTFNLSKYTVTNGKYFGNVGCPNELFGPDSGVTVQVIDPQTLQLVTKPLSEVRKKLSTVVRPQTAAEACDALKNGHPIVAGSNQGFTEVRDSQGFCIPSGEWAHCTYWRGYCNYGPRPFMVYQQSWGPGMPSGPRLITLPDGKPVTLPEGAFCVDMDVFEKRILSEGDSYILAASEGFTTLDYKLY